jgi:hypothetical protein
MFAPINFAGATPFNDWFVPDTTRRHPLGYMVDAVDPYWGYGKFMYIESDAAILKGSLVVVGVMPTFLGTLLPSTASLGRPFGVAMAPMADGTFGWIQLVGHAVYKTSATVAADAAVGIGTAGMIGAYSTLKGLVGVRNLVAATGTTTWTANTQNGKGYIDVPNGYDGAFVGMALSGSGVPASTVVAKLDPNGTRIYTGSAIGTLGDKNSTATGSITLTGTYTGYGAGHITFPSSTPAVA